MANKWITFIKEYAKKNNLTYSCALSDPECIKAYRLENPKIEKKKVMKNIMKPEKKDYESLLKEETDYTDILEEIKQMKKIEPKPKKEPKFQNMQLVVSTEPVKKGANMRIKIEKPKITKQISNLSDLLNLSELPDLSKLEKEVDDIFSIQKLKFDISKKPKIPNMRIMTPELINKEKDIIKFKKSFKKTIKNLLDILEVVKGKSVDIVSKLKFVRDTRSILDDAYNEIYKLDDYDLKKIYNNYLDLILSEIQNIDIKIQKDIKKEERKKKNKI